MELATPSSRSAVKSAFHRVASPRVGGSPALRTPVVASTGVSENDDEAERRMRRRGNQIRFMASPGTHTPRTAPRTEQRQNSIEISTTSLSNAQMAEHYANCIKLSSENKITSRNAFGLHLIEHMLEILTLRGEMTNFQVASSTLDAGAKIYAGRVDSIYTDAYKMLGGLGREQQAETTESPDGDNVSGPRKKTKQSAVPSAQTIEKNLKSLDINTFDLEFEVDPLFKRTSAAFDEGGVAGLLLNHLFVRDSMCELALSATEAPPAHDSPVESSQIDLGQDRGLFSTAGLASKQICPSFSSFLFSKDNSGKSWSLDDFLSSKQSSSEPGDQYRPLSGGDTSMLHGAPCDDDDDYAEYANQADMTVAERDPAMDTTLLGVCADSKMAEFVPADKMQRALPHGGVMSTDSGKLLLSEAFEPSEYSYFNPSIVATWAGPNHWKLAFGKKQSGDAAEKIPKKKQTQTRYRVDFLKEIDSSAEDRFKKSKAATQLSTQALAKLDQLRTTLPRKAKIDSQIFHKLACRPKWMVRRQRKLNNQQINDPLDGQWYDYDNPNDNLNYCPAIEENNGESGSDTENMPEQLEDETVGNFYNQTQGLFNITDLQPQCSVLMGDNLVAQPRKVQQIQIDYAKSAKRMDVKRLKSEMWKVLAVKQAEEVQPEGGTLTKSDFSTVYSLLPTQLPSGMVKNLSVPMCFVCLLHLANEKELEIHADNKLTTVSIEVPQHL